MFWSQVNVWWTLIRVLWAWDLWMQGRSKGDRKSCTAIHRGSSLLPLGSAMSLLEWWVWNLSMSRTFYLLLCIRILFYVWVTLGVQNWYRKSWEQVHRKGFRSLAWPLANQPWVRGLDCFQDELDTLQRGLAHNTHMELCSGWKKRASSGQLPLPTQIPGPEPDLLCTARAGCQRSLPCLKFYFQTTDFSAVCSLGLANISKWECCS